MASQPHNTIALPAPASPELACSSRVKDGAKTWPFAKCLLVDFALVLLFLNTLTYYYLPVQDLLA